MHVDKYQLRTEEERTRFEFISEGPNGAVRKLVEFQQTLDPDVYNLAFGDKHPGRLPAGCPTPYATLMALKNKRIPKDASAPGRLPRGMFVAQK